MGDQVVTKHRRVHSKPDDVGANEVVEDMTLKDKREVGHASMANGCSNVEGNHCGQSELAESWENADALGTNADATGELNKQGSRFDKVSDIHKMDGLQELLKLAGEFESEEVLQGDSDRKAHSQNDGIVEEYSLQPKTESNSNVKEDIHKEGIEASCFGEARLTSGASEGEASASCSLPEAKSDRKGDQRSPENKEELNCDQVHASMTRRRSRSASSASITVGPSRSQFTIPQPFSLATDKRALGGGRPRDAENGPLQRALGSNASFGDTNLKTPESSRKLGSRLHVAKFVHPESIKFQVDSFKKLLVRETLEHRDEDAMSISSIRSCSLAPKAKASRFTSTSSFKFQSEVRAEKRKEYYAQLQERLVAKEEEMNQMQAKAKKEREEEIKLLRRSLTFKAHPIPSFYQEGPPPKAELLKTPTTRAKSPNFSRRESSLGGSTRLCNMVKCDADHRSSLSPHKPGKSNNVELPGPFTKSPHKKTAEGNTPSSGSVSELLDVEFSVDMADMHVKVRDPLTVSSELMLSDEEEKVHHVQVVNSEHVSNNGGVKVYHDEVFLITPDKAYAAIDSCLRPDCQQVRASNVLQGQINVNAGGLCNKTKAGKKAQPLVHEDMNDLQGKEGSRKQRLKALTPCFRKRESRRDEEESAAKKEMPHVGYE